ncbi:MAG TPA: helix-turn-helix domain-containing protein [Candidatus Cybelea sp.]
MARDVLVVISSFANKKTGRSWPSIETIATALRVSEKSVKAAVAELCALGIIRSFASNKRLGQSNLYCLAIDGEPFQVTNGVINNGDSAETPDETEAQVREIGSAGESPMEARRQPSTRQKLPLDEVFLEQRRAILLAIWDLLAKTPFSATITRTEWGKRNSRAASDLARLGVTP